MGLQDQLTDVSTESIPILVVAIIANCVCYLRSLLFAILHGVGILSPEFVYAHQIDDSLYDAVGSGLAGVVLLAEQLNLNRVFSYKFEEKEGVDIDGDTAGSDCVVCLNRLGDGDNVRKLACHHIFHKDCFDGWLDQFNFNCPLCRSSLISGERVVQTRRRVSEDVLNWFSER